jgi:hypothetical protein
MNVDKTAQDTDLSSIPGEFRENYRFLTELINCKDKNKTAAECLENVVESSLYRARGKLNRRQMKIIKDFLTGIEEDDSECFAPPVPVELEAAIRVKKRSTWLPWEAEAIRKIERWRGDLEHIATTWPLRPHKAAVPRRLTVVAESSG